MTIRLCASFLLALLIPMPGLAESQAGGEFLSPEVLTQQVLAANPGLTGRRAATAALRAEADVADELDDARFSLGTAPNTIDSSLDGRTLVQLSQTVPWPGKRRLRAEAAASQADASAQAEFVLARDLAARARTLWSDWWYLHMALERNAEEQRLVADLLPVAEAQYAAGLGLQQDLLHAETRGLHLEHQRLALEQRRRALASRINALRGRVATAPVSPPTALPSASVVAPREKLAEALRATHPELGALDAALSAAEARLALARRDYWPDFRLYTGYVGTLDPAEKRWQIGAEINLPFGGDKRRAAVSSASLRQERLAAEKADAEFRLLAELQSLLARMEEAESVIDLYRDRILPLSRQALAAARADFESGRGEFANVIDAETALLEAGLTLDRARADRFAIAAGIEALTGIDTSLQEGGR